MFTSIDTAINIRTYEKDHIQDDHEIFDTHICASLLPFISFNHFGF